jgi:predicted permease
MMGLSLLGIGAIGLLAWSAGRLLRFERGTLAAVMLTSMFMNAGNLGLPVIRFAFGEQALALGSLYFVTNSTLAYSLGVLIASMGRATLGVAIKNALKAPAVYALALAFLSLRLGWKLPMPVGRTVELLGDAAVPSMLVLLGMQLNQARWVGNLKPLALTSGLRLLVSPLLAIGMTLAMGITGAARQAGVIEAGMPVAVLNTVLSTEYDVEPAFVSAAVLVTTLLSPFSLTLLLAYLGG